MSTTPCDASLVRLLTASAVAVAAFLLAAGSAHASSECTKVAAPNGSDAAAGTVDSPFATPQKLAGSLSAGEVGCLRGGSYTRSSGYVLSPPRGGRSGAPIAFRSYPGERARLIGIVNVSNGVDHVTFSGLDFEGTGGMNTIKIYAADVVVEDSEITNAWRGLSCMMLGSNGGGGAALRTVIRRNTIHACGDPANGNKDHGIYASNVVEGEIVDNVIYDSAAYAIQLYPNAQRTRFAHNVVDGGDPSIRGGLVFGGDDRHASTGNVVEHNVIAHAATHNVTASWGGAPGSGNVARDNCLWAGRHGELFNGGGLTAAANATADPGFRARDAHDYRLAPDSPCLAKVGYDTAAKLAGTAAPDPAPAPAPEPEPETAPHPVPEPVPAPVPEPEPAHTPVPPPAPAPAPERSPAPHRPAAPEHAAPRTRSGSAPRTAKRTRRPNARQRIGRRRARAVRLHRRCVRAARVARVRTRRRLPGRTRARVARRTACAAVRRIRLDRR